MQPGDQIRLAAAQPEFCREFAGFGAAAREIDRLVEAAAFAAKFDEADAIGDLGVILFEPLQPCLSPRMRQFLRLCLRLRLRMRVLGCCRDPIELAPQRSRA